MKRILIVMSIILMLISVNFITTVSAYPSGWYELTDFDNFLLGEVSGWDGDIYVQNMSVTYPSIQGSAEPTGDRYYRFGPALHGSGCGTDYKYAWINNTNYSSLGYFVGVYAYGIYNAYATTQTDLLCSFYNETGTEVVTIFFNGAPQNGGGYRTHYQYYDYLGNPHTLWTASGTGDASGKNEWYITWQYYTDNIIQYKVYNDDFVCVKTENGTGRISGLDFYNQSQFNCSDCFFTCTNAESGSSCHYSYETAILYHYGIKSGELDLPDYFYPDTNLSARCSNYNPSQGSSYSQLFEIESECEPNWACMISCKIVSQFYALNCIDDCMDCSWTMNPVKYFEHKTEGYYNETIRHVLLPISNDQRDLVSDDPEDYSCLINNVDCGTADYIVPYDVYYALIWENVNVTVDGNIVFSFYSSKHTEGFSKDWYWYGVAGFYGGWGDTRVHNDVIKYYDGQLTGTYMGNWKATVCWYYDNSSTYEDTEPYNLPTINEFDDFFGMGDTGNGYVEWLGWQTDCYYKMGIREKPTIVYNLTGFGTGNGTKLYYYAIYKLKTGVPSVDRDEIVYNDFIEVTNRDWSRDIRYLGNTFSFPSAGKYYIMVYNMSGTSEIESFVHQSLLIEVCPADTDGGGEDIYHIFPYLGQPLGSIVGLIFTIFMLLTPFILQGILNINYVHPLVYMMTGGLGLGISTIIGWFPSWLPFFIIGIGIIIIVFSYLYGQRVSSGG